MTEPTILHVLLIDDDIDDRFLFKSAVAKTALQVLLDDARDCPEALSKLEKMGNDLPDIIFIDLNMPDIDGFECMKRIKLNAAWAGIPLIVYSTSSSPAHIEEAGRLGAVAYIKKPNDFGNLCKLIEKIFTMDLTTHTSYLGIVN